MGYRSVYAGTVGYMGGGVPPYPQWLACWTDFLAFNAERFTPGSIHYRPARVTYHPQARNQLAAEFLGEWLLMLDTDHAFRPSLLWQLLHVFDSPGAGIDVLCGLYQQKHPPHYPLLYSWVDAGSPATPAVLPVVRWSRDFPVFPVGSAGGGCLLVRRTVFDRIRRELREEPFDPLPVKVEPLPPRDDEDGTSPPSYACRGSWSEDHSFFLRLRRLGIKAFVDTRVRYDHLRVVAVTTDDFDAELCQPAREGTPVAGFDAALRAVGPDVEGRDRLAPRDDWRAPVAACGR